jgi:virulence-associated protein VapD
MRAEIQGTVYLNANEIEIHYSDLVSEISYEQIASEIDLDQISDLVSDLVANNISNSDIAAELDQREIAIEVAESFDVQEIATYLDYQELGCHISYGRVVSNMSYYDLAQEIDQNEVADIIADVYIGNIANYIVANNLTTELGNKLVDAAMSKVNQELMSHIDMLEKKVTMLNIQLSEISQAKPIRKFMKKISKKSSTSK